LQTSLSANRAEGANRRNNSCGSDETQDKVREVFRRNETIEIRWRFVGVLIGFIGGIWLLCYIEFVYVDSVNRNGIILWGLRVSGGPLVFTGFGCGLLPIYWDYDATYGCNEQYVSHAGDTVAQKLLTMPYYCNTLFAIGRANMANILSIDKQVAIISALAGGSGTQQIERMTGVHRDTIMRLGVHVGKGCTTLMDSKMRDLPCENLRFDELWGFIG
jgi:hypothetical protein